jgi:hypothetical protein
MVRAKAGALWRLRPRIDDHGRGTDMLAAMLVARAQLGHKNTGMEGTSFVLMDGPPRRAVYKSVDMFDLYVEHLTGSTTRRSTRRSRPR